MLDMRLDSIRGWFPETDQILFDWLLEHQLRHGVRGHLAEIGVYLGRTAIHLGRHLRQDETLTVCDLFESPAPDEENQREIDDYGHYGDTVSVAAFLANYGAFHAKPPVVIKDDSARICDAVEAAAFRFVHVDASHLYVHVRQDIASARQMLTAAGVVVVDDYRARHSPGVGAAVWEAVLLHGLHPLMVTERKFYGTWWPNEPLQESLLEFVSSHPTITADIQQVAGHRLIRLIHPEAPA
ncbi:class I SAM-dependent methyltransferase [Micromonospora sp. DT62]|uniref:class I SAM-dependent methyltransferase n=1 Tax=Micromonospora sp. DT62 TaxID=3416521 RepID=UPI003CEC3337